MKPPVTTTTATPATTTMTTPPVTTTTTATLVTTTTTTPVTTTTTPPVGTTAQAPVNLGAAASFAILSKSGITDVPSSIITGNVGTSPISGAYFGVTCPEVTGTIFSVNAAGPACRVTDATGLTAAVSDEETAYTDAAGRTNPAAVNLGAGQIGGLTMAPGLYKWTSNVGISSDVTLAGGPNDVWIFQISGPESSSTEAVACPARVS